LTAWVLAPSSYYTEPMQTRIEVRDDHYVARVLDSSDVEEMQAALVFRHRVFLEELGWACMEEESGHDHDRYDDSSVHFVAFDENNEVAAYCRLILPQSGFMIETEFSDLVEPGHRIRKDPDTAEISRFAVTRTLRGKIQGFSLIALLLRTVYGWAMANHLRYIYGVCATDHLSFVQAYFPWVQSVGPAYEYQPGVSSSALLADLRTIDVEKTKEFWASVIGKPR
jgi:N-acyl-L-homoserine lactone synthetase